MNDQDGTTAGFPGSIRLFQVWGINVFLHWSWAVIAVVELQFRQNHYSHQAWNAAEYVSIFIIVLLHEFGHALACRSVGGRADRILLWPLGGIAYVQPPMRPGAMLWSLAAGPLVNVVLLPVTLGAYMLAPEGIAADLGSFLFAVAAINLILLVFNMLPIYPLDGGQIVQSILWFFIGFRRSLLVATSIGFLGAACVIILAAVYQDLWFVVLACFGLSRSWQGFQLARRLTDKPAVVENPAISHQYADRD